MNIFIVSMFNNQACEKPLRSISDGRYVHTQKSRDKKSYTYCL